MRRCRERRAWDGLGPAPDGDRPGRGISAGNARSKHEIIFGMAAKPNIEPEGKEAWAQRDAADRADDARLTKQLMICRDGMPASVRDNANGSATR
jgi:hypothetical protein